MPKIDWSEGLLPEGEYVLLAHQVRELTDRGGSLVWYVDWLVIEPARLRGRRFTDRMSWKETAMWYTRRIMAAAFPEDVRAGKIVDYKPQDLEGKLIRAKVELRKIGDEKYNRIAWARWLSTGEDEELKEAIEVALRRVREAEEEAKDEEEIPF